MIQIRNFIDATFLKTTADNLTSTEVKQYVEEILVNAAAEKYKAVMIRPEFVAYAKAFLQEQNSKVRIGTVIDFPKGQGGLEAKLHEAEKAIEAGADELDFVIDYEAFKKGEEQKVANEVREATAFVLRRHKTAKWIIETAALNHNEIIRITTLIKNTVIRYFKETDYENVFVKSSTGFYPAEDGKPNGATIEHIVLMLENAAPLPVKASGGIRSYKDAVQLVQMGVKRLGTSAQKAIVKEEKSAGQ